RRGRELDTMVRTSPETTKVRAYHHACYYYEAKYFVASAVNLACPAELPEEATRRVRELAVATFDALSCEGLARVDFFYTPSGEVIVNDVNTMPAFTPFSMYAMLWERSGLCYHDTLTDLTEQA